MAEEDAASESARDNRLRRLHRVLGVVALAAFATLHLCVQGSALGGGSTYDAVAGALSRSTILPVFELVFVGLPLLFHAAYGLNLLAARKPAASDVQRYGGERPWTIQRVSAVFVAVFLAIHLGDFRLRRVFSGLSPDALYTALTARLSWTVAGFPAVAILYLVGIFAVALHVSNGLFAASSEWNIGKSPSGRVTLRRLTVGFGVLLFVLGAASIIGLATGTRLLPAADGDRAPAAAPCGSDTPPKAPLFPAPSR
jgi:succinate dehydrogenase/fumarate reductase cytochrome b subunit